MVSQLPAINRIDATGVEIFAAVRTAVAAQGVTLHISGMKLPVEKVLVRAGQLQESQLLRLYRTDTEAIAHLATACATPNRQSGGDLKADK